MPMVISLIWLYSCDVWGEVEAAKHHVIWTRIMRATSASADLVQVSAEVRTTKKNIQTIDKGMHTSRCPDPERRRLLYMYQMDAWNFIKVRMDFKCKMVNILIGFSISFTSWGLLLIVRPFLLPRKHIWRHHSFTDDKCWIVVRFHRAQYSLELVPWLLTNRNHLFGNNTLMSLHYEECNSFPRANKAFLWIKDVPSCCSPPLYMAELQKMYHMVFAHQTK